MATPADLAAKNAARLRAALARLAAVADRLEAEAAERPDRWPAAETLGHLATSLEERLDGLEVIR